jgi:hypothetical protein
VFPEDRVVSKGRAEDFQSSDAKPAADPCEFRNRDLEIGSHRTPRMHTQPAARQKGVQCCLEDEGRPLGVGLQGRIPNHLKLRWSRARVVSVEEKSCRSTAGEDQKDERKRTVDDVSKRFSKTSKPGGVSIPGQAQRMPTDCLRGVRHNGGVTLVQAFRWNECRGTMAMPLRAT